MILLFLCVGLTRTSDGLAYTRTHTPPTVVVRVDGYVVYAGCVIVRPSLYNCDSCLYYIPSCIYRAPGRLIKYDTARGIMITSLLLLLSGIEPNPGPVLRPSVIRIGTLNARSAVNKGPLVCDLITDHSLDVAIITETWFSDSMPPAITEGLAPAGYSSVQFTRTGAKGGGVSIVYPRKLQVREFRFLNEYNTLEVIGLRVISGSSVWNIIGIYRPPPASNSEFFDEFRNLLGELDLLPGKHLVMGDFNCPGASSDVVDGRFVTVVDSLGYHIHRSPPTRAGATSENLLDLLVHDADDDSISDFSVVDPGISDHFLVKAAFKFPTPKSKMISFNCLNLKRLDFEKLE